MNIGNTVKYPIKKRVNKSIWNTSHNLITITPFESIVDTIDDLIKTPINESIWISAYDGVCENITL